MKNHRLIGIFLSIVLIWGLWGCQKADPSPQEDTFRVVTSFYPMYILAENLMDGAKEVTLSNMAGSTQGCLHDYELSVNDIKLLENADLFVINGAGIESFTDKLQQTLPNLSTVALSDGYENLIHSEGHGHEHEGQSDVNGHVWGSPLGALYEAERLCKTLMVQNPANAEVYQKNLETFSAELTSLYQEMQQISSTLSKKELITFHEGFDYLARDLGLEIVGVMAYEPEQSPSAKEIEELVTVVKKHQITALFAEAQYPDNIPNLIANETGAKVYTLDLVVSGDTLPDKDRYVTVMRENLAILQEALQ